MQARQPCDMVFESSGGKPGEPIGDSSDVAEADGDSSESILRG